MGLTRYQQKRNFTKTPEPKGRAHPKKGERLQFVVQKHAASHLHFDLRLEFDGVLWSWAVPKGPSLNPSDKRLAIHVEDHPVEYASFEGTIPKGQYGGGTVMLWDRGAWTPPKDPARALRRGKLTFTLHGDRLAGEWTLTRIRKNDDDQDERDQWLLIKSDDEAARRKGSITGEAATSVSTGRTMDQIAAGHDAQGDNHKKSGSANGRKQPRKDRNTAIDPSSLPGAKKARMPTDASPQLCILADHVPEGEDWVHEIKFDGYRFLVHVKAGQVTVRSRNDKDWTSRFKPLVDAFSNLALDSAIIDGEACVLDAQGQTSFQNLQNSIKARDFHALAFFAFDLLYLNGLDLTESPLLERKKALRSIIPGADTSIIRYSEHIEGRGRQVEQRACELDLEGVICKRADSIYEQRRAATWLKVKCSKRQEFVVIGWTPPSGARKHFGSLLLAAHDADGQLRYTGKVGTGFTASSLRDIAKRMEGLARRTCPADVPPEPAERRDARWIKPELVAEVEFTQWTNDRRLRHPSFQGLREDKAPESVAIERPKSVEEIEVTAEVSQSASSGKSGHRAAPTRKSRDSSGVEVAGVRLSNADRVLYPEQGATKLDLAEYYASVAEHILPYLVGRPLSTVRCPRGREGECFFQKHLGETLTDPVRAIRVTEKDGAEADYIGVDSVQGLITLVQFGVLEFHPWGSTARHIESPDTLTFDLDPGEGVTFDAVKSAATEVRAGLESIGLKPYLKASGGKGLHIVVPVKPDSDWDAAKHFCEAFAKAMAAQDPNRYIAVASKARRKGRVFIDYLRNSRGATSIAPYSTRARPGAPVAVPLRWGELSRLDSASRYDITTLPRRLRSLKADPWADFRKNARSIPELQM